MSPRMRMRSPPPESLAARENPPCDETGARTPRRLRPRLSRTRRTFQRSARTHTRTASHAHTRHAHRESGRLQQLADGRAGAPVSIPALRPHSSPFAPRPDPIASDPVSARSSHPREWTAAITSPSSRVSSMLSLM